MAEDAAASSTSEEPQITFNVKASTEDKYVVTVPASMTVAELKAKLSTTEYANVPVERMRLIYSGRVLKDPDTLATAKVKDNHTIHMVKSAASNARQNPAQASGSGASGSTPVPQVPTNIAAGTGNNPLAGLTGARYAGFHGLPGMDTFGPDGGMGPPPNSEQLLELMDNPNFLSQMNEAMNNPAVIEMMTQSPMFRNNPMLAEMVRNPEMRRLLFDPNMLRMQLQMQRSMGNRGPSFPAPGVTDTTPQTGTGTNTATPGQNNPTGTTPTQANPFASLFGNNFPPRTQPLWGSPFNPANLAAAQTANPNAPTTPATNPSANQTATAGSPSTPNPTPSSNTGTSPPPTNPHPFGGLFGSPPAGGQQNDPIMEMTRQMMQNPEMMRSAMQMMGLDPSAAGTSPFGVPPSAVPGAGGPPPPSPFANPFAALLGQGGLGGGLGSPPPQADNRPPEEVYEVQLRQLNEMGFFEFERNVQALRRSGGSVQGAIEYLLGGGGS